MLIKHLVNIVLLPISGIVILPWLIASQFGYKLFWGLDSIPMLFLFIFGTFFVTFGLILMVVSISLFISKGDGTIAPWNPTKKLITINIYSYVRNPMILGGFCILIGESILFGSFFLSLYTFLFILGNLFYIPLIEEPKLLKRFGKEYQAYIRKVPRWIPRCKE